MAQNENEKPAGHGKVFSTLAGLSLGAGVGRGVGALPASFKAQREGLGLSAEAFEIVGRSKGTQIGAWVGAGALGAYGYAKAKKGQEQFADVVGQRDEAVAAKAVSEAKANYAEQFGSGHAHSHSDKVAADKESAEHETHR